MLPSPSITPRRNSIKNLLGTRNASRVKDFLGIEDYFQVTGAFMTQKTKLSRNPVFIIKFGKMAARRILSECYYQEATALYRKARLAQQCIRSYPGWTSSLTVK